METKFTEHADTKFRPFEPASTEKPFDSEWLELRPKFNVLVSEHFFGADVQFKLTDNEYLIPGERSRKVTDFYNLCKSKGYKNNTLLTFNSLKVLSSGSGLTERRVLQITAGKSDYYSALAWLDGTLNIPNPNSIILSALVRTRDGYLVFAERGESSSAGKGEIGVIGGSQELIYRTKKELRFKGDGGDTDWALPKIKDVRDGETLIPEDPFFAMREEVESELGIKKLFKDPDGFTSIILDNGKEIIVRDSDGKRVSQRVEDRTPGDYPVEINMTSVIRDTRKRICCVFEVLLPITKKTLEKHFYKSKAALSEHKKLLFVRNNRQSLIRFANSNGVSRFHEPARELILMGEAQSTWGSSGEVVRDERYL